jgi:hypothetical protein
MPKTVNITISDVIAHKLELMDINPNKACSAMLEWLVTDCNKNIGMLFIIERTHEKIRELETDIATLESKKTLLRQVKQELKILEATYKDAEGKLDLIDLQSYLNRRIVAYHYDIREIESRHSDIIAKIKQYDKRFNLQKHINKVRLMREETLL